MSDLDQIIDQLGVIAHNLKTQDNRITDTPLFCVMQKQRVYGVGADYGGIQERVFDDCIGKYRKVRYVEIDVFVTACLTEQGCKDYIRINGHNLKQPFIFAFSGYRNAEWELLHEALPVILEVLKEGKANR